MSKNADRFLRAAEDGNDLEVFNILEVEAVNQLNKDAALRLAAENGHLEVVQLLLDHGADLHTKTDYAIRFAAAHGHTEVVQLLLSRGAHVNPNTYVVYHAAINKQLSVVKLLLSAGYSENIIWWPQYFSIEQIVEELFFPPLFVFILYQPILNYLLVHKKYQILKAGSVIQIGPYQLELTNNNVLSHLNNNTFWLTLKSVIDTRTSPNINQEPLEPIDPVWFSTNQLVKVLGQGTYNMKNIFETYSPLVNTINFDCYQQFVDRFDQPTHQAILFYTNRGDKIMHDMLRGIESYDSIGTKYHNLTRNQIIKSINLINQAIWSTDFCLTDKIILYRGFQNSAPISPGSLIGDQYNKFISFTDQLDTAADYGLTIFRLELDPGSQVKLLPLDLEHSASNDEYKFLTYWPGEHEYLLPLGTIFEVSDFPKYYNERLIIPIRLVKQDYLIYDGQLNQLPNEETNTIIDFLSKSTFT